MDFNDLSRQLRRKDTVDVIRGNGGPAVADADASFLPQKQVLPKYLLHPDSRKLEPWQLLTAGLLLYIAIFTPFEVAFLPAPTTLTDPYFILGRIIDAVFIIDVLMQFFIMVPRLDEANEMETNHRVIITRYLNGGWVL